MWNQWSPRESDLLNRQVIEPHMETHHEYAACPATYLRFPHPPRGRRALPGTTHTESGRFPTIAVQLGGRESDATAPRYPAPDGQLGEGPVPGLPAPGREAFSGLPLAPF